MRGDQARTGEIRRDRADLWSHAAALLRDQINELKKQSGQEPMKTMGPAPKKKKRAGKKKSARKKVTYTIKRRKRKD